MIFNGTSDFALAAAIRRCSFSRRRTARIAGWGPPATPITPNSAGVGQSTAITKVDESKNGAGYDLRGSKWMAITSCLPPISQPELH